MNSEQRENKGYNSMYDRKTTAKRNNDIVGAESYKIESKEKEERKFAREVNEKGYSKELAELGKFCYMTEYFNENFKITNFPQVGPFANPEEQESFKNAYNITAPAFAKNYTYEIYELNVEKFKRAYPNYYEYIFTMNNAKHR